MALATPRQLVDLNDLDVRIEDVEDRVEIERGERVLKVVHEFNLRVG